jgi:hypothetical protein
MVKYRITNERKHNLTSPTFYIERKGIFGWRKLKITENRDWEYVKFSTYEEAEYYLIKTYCKWDGEIYQPIANYYYYTKQNYAFY